MDQHRRLYRLARLFLRELGRGQVSEFLLPQRQQFIRGVLIAALDRQEDLRNVAHEHGFRGWAAT